jgi:hypothetical protein
MVDIKEQVMNEDLDQLRLLTIFHYVVATLAGLFSLFPIIHLVVGIAVVTGHLGNNHGSAPIPAFFGWLFIVLAGTMMILGFALAICIFLAGRSLARRRHYMLCLVAAGVECTFMPFGTILGVFTIIVLQKPSVKELFGKPMFAAT